MKLSEIVQLICYKTFDPGMKVSYLGVAKRVPYEIAEVLVQDGGKVVLRLVGYSGDFDADMFCEAK